MSTHLSRHFYALLLLAYSILNPLKTNSQVVINEFVASNTTGLTDDDGDYPDWIELYNNSSSAVDLTGYSITDDIKASAKWPFPSITLSPNSFLVILASGKDRTNLVNEWYTIIDQGDDVKYLVPENEIESWTTLTFDDTSWLTEPSGIGYGDGDDATEISACMSVYVRKKFTIDDINNISQTVLHLDYDDGFVAYLNGVEVARDNLGEAGSTVAYNQGSDNYNHEAQMFQGLPPNEFEVLNWEDILIEGENILAIQVHNYSTSSSDLTCIPFLTLGLKSPMGYSSSQYLDLPTSYLHTNFKIKAEGESLYLFNNNVLVDSIGSTPLNANISYGRINDGDTWGYFDSPTPSETNSGDFATTLNTDSVEFSVKGGMHSSTISLTLSDSNNTESNIYYTTDGNTPDANSNLYSAPISISSDMVIRARIINTGQLAGPVVTNTYLIGKSHQMPIVCLSTNPDNFWDYFIGIYVKGPNAQSENPYFGANFWMDWEKPVHFEYYDVNNVKQIDQGAGVKIYGNYSRANDLKSMALFARKEYGDGSFSYKFFNNRANDKFEALVLRNSGNDFYYTHFRDGLMGDIMEPMGLESQGFQPTVVYLNGEYWGILNLREKINEHFISDHSNIEADSINILENYGNVVQGQNTEYTELLDYINNNNLTVEDNYKQVKNYIDVDNYIDYMLAQTFIDNRDWPGNNIKYWNTTSDRSRYRWILYDTDFGFNLYGDDNYKYNSIADALATNGPDWPNPPWSTLLFRKLKTNSSFKEEFVKRGKHYLNTCWESSIMNAKIDSLKQIYLTEMKDHCSKWNLDYNNWLYQVDRLKTFSNNRPYYFEKYLSSSFGYTQTVLVNLQVSSELNGYIKIDGNKINSFPYSDDYYANTEVELKAVPLPGYRFVKWQGDSSDQNPTITVSLNQNIELTAVFEAAENTDINVVFNEVFYKSSETIKPGDWVELFNVGKTSVDLKNWSFSDTKEDSAFVFSESLLLEPKEYLVICKDLERFKTTYPTVNNVIGEFEFGLSSTGDYLRLYDNYGTLIDAVDYYTNGTWPAEANGLGASAEVINPSNDNSVSDNWEASLNGGTPGGPNQSYEDVGIFTPYTQLEAQLKCTPNPMQNQTRVYFYATKADEYQLKLSSIAGNTLFTSEIIYCHEGEQQYNLTLDKSLPAGLYLLSLYGQGKQECIKLIIYK